MTVLLLLFAGLTAAAYAAMAALCRHSRLRLHRIEGLNKGLERKATEDADRLRAIFAAVRVGTWSHNLISNRVVLEGRINEVYGFTASRTECGFEEILESIHPEDRAKILNAPLASEGGNVDFEFRVVQPDQSVHWIWSVGGVSSYAGGKPAALGGINLEITRRKNAEIALRRSEAEIRELNETLEQRVRAGTAQLLDSERRFRLMVEGVQDYAIFMLDTDGRVASWNLGAERIYGYRADEVVGRGYAADEIAGRGYAGEKVTGKHLSIFCAEEDFRGGEPERELRQAAIDGRVAKEGWRVRRDGSRFWANVVLTAVYNDAGDLCAFCQVTRDITERRRAQQQLEEQRARAEAANQAKSEFLAAMSHEIRTPMNAILGMTDLLWDTELDEDQRHYVEIFRQAGANLMDLINNILDLSKIESGRLELEQSEFNLDSVVGGVVELLGPRARDKGIALRSEVAPEAARGLIGDAARLRQILVNLVGNAIKFTNAGEVAISADNLQGGHPGELSFIVSDTGMGIPPDRLDAIFDPFAQVDSSISRKFGGTGLGLAICRRLVESMGGAMRVESEPGKGSAFHFTARFDVAAASPPVKPGDAAVTPAAASGAATRKLLIAEDLPDNQFLIQAYLKHRPYTLVLAANGRIAVNQWISQCAEAPFDAVLMDVQMPVMDGLTAARSIREIERKRGLRPVPMLALTANAYREDVEACRQAGFTAHVSKPVTKAALLEALDALLEGDTAEVMEHPVEQSIERAREPIPITAPEGLELLAPRYLSARRKELQEMVAYLAASDFEQISSRGHNMKGTGRSYGFPDLTDIGAALERLATHEDKDGIDKQLLRLANYLESVRLPVEAGRG